MSPKRFRVLAERVGALTTEMYLANLNGYTSRALELDSMLSRMESVLWAGLADAQTRLLAEAVFQRELTGVFNSALVPHPKDVLQTTCGGTPSQTAEKANQTNGGYG